MHVYINEKPYKTIKYDDIDQSIRAIDEIIKQEGLIYSHILLNGKFIYQEYREYLSNCPLHIANLEVKTLTVDYYIEDTLYSAYNYMQNAIPVIEKLASAFYHKATDVEWNKLTDLLEGLQWIVLSFSQINSLTELRNDAWDEYSLLLTQLNEILPELESAISIRDTVGIGDQLMYEIIPLFQGMLKELKLLLPEGTD